MVKSGERYASYQPKLEWNAGVFEYLSQAYGQEHFAKISEALTSPSIHACVRVNTLQTSTKEVVKQLNQHLRGEQDRCLKESEGENNVPNISAGSRALYNHDVRLLENVDLKETSHRGPRLQRATTGTNDEEEKHPPMCFEHELLENVVMVKGKGPCAINYEAVKGEGGLLKEIVVSRKCAEAVLRGAHVFVPGVLACSGHIEKDELVAVSVAVERPDGEGGWCVGVTRGTTLSSEHARSQFGDTARSGWFIGTGRAMMTRANLFRESNGVAVQMLNRVFDLPPFHGLLKGDIFLQNLPSIVAARVLDPQPGERILDMCAAPGGKTTAIALLMEDKGELIALDRSHNKVSDIVRLAEEMKLTCIKAFKMDALKSVLVEASKTKAALAQSLGVETIMDTQDELVNEAVKREGLSKALYQLQEPLLQSASEGELEAARVPERAYNGHNSDEPPSTSNDHTLIPSAHTHKSWNARKREMKESGAYASRAAARKDARRLRTGSKETAEGESPCKKGFIARSFDRVLLDAPCSALGIRPRLFAGVETLEGLRKHAIYQRRLMDQAVQLVRPGGTIVYSTCTLNPGENEGVVRYVLDTYPYLALAPQHPRIGGPGLVGGHDVFDGATFRCWLREEERHMVQRFDPVAPYDTIGFFVAKFLVRSPESLPNCGDPIRILLTSLLPQFQLMWEMVYKKLIVKSIFDKMGREVHAHIIDTGFQLDVHIGNALVNM